ncbi:MAG: hypothetical protein GH155_06180 [Spirochaeta sp.]|nr:hypothetical protein [Spirochaeta sp.]
MVRKRFLLLILLILCFIAAGCKFFAASAFPSYLTQISAFVDLGDEMGGFIGGAGEDFECRLDVMKNSSGREYIFLVIHVFSPDKKKVIILDNSLKVRKELEDPRLGELHMVDANGDFLIGNVLFSQVDLTLLLSPGVDPYRQGFSDGANNFIMWMDGGLPYQQYSNVWGPGSTQYPVVGAGIFNLENIGYSLDRHEVTLFLNRVGDDYSQVILIPAADFWPPAITTPIIGNYPFFPVDRADRENYHYTNDGIVVNNHDGVAKLYGFDGAVKAEFPICYDSDWVEAYDTEGSHYYHLDVRARRLYRCGTWW